MHPNAPTFRREDGYILRPARAGDAQAYWQASYCPIDPELARLTGCKERFTREEVLAYFARCMAADDRCDSLLLSPKGRFSARASSTRSTSPCAAPASASRCSPRRRAAVVWAHGPSA